MLSDIVVHIPVDHDAASVIACAVSTAALFDAHLDGIAGIYQPVNPAIMVGASAAYFAVPSENDTGSDQAAARLDQFEIAARSSGISHGGRSIRDTPALANQTFAEISRLYDLSIVAQPDRNRPSYYDALAEAVLFHSGRPMLLIPFIHTGPLKTGRVLICWDGGRPAARAVHDAMPFLHKASAIDIVAVNEGEEGESPTSSAALVAHLARHDLAATTYRFNAESFNIHNAILSLAADSSTDLMVMGGYGHSRLREFVLGGVTRGILKSLTVPALISH